MAGLCASMAVKLGLDKLSSFLHLWPMASSSSSLAMQDDQKDLSRLERTMHRIRATLEDAEEHWNIREESAKLRLEELKEVAYDAEDVVDEYEYEVNRCKLEALERSTGVQSSNNKRKRHESKATEYERAVFRALPRWWGRRRTIQLKHVKRRSTRGMSACCPQSHIFQW